MLAHLIQVLFNYRRAWGVSSVLVYPRPVVRRIVMIPIAHQDLSTSLRSLVCLVCPVYSLQKGGASANIKEFGCEALVTDLGERIRDFSDTVAVIGQLDLVITVDTALAHLAGAMGKPVWVAVPFAPDWRWMRDIETSPWYPSMRLFRQKRHGAWEGVFGDIRRALRDEIVEG